jgi:hypothetical protein
MDESVIAAIAHWPDVPHVHGWLSLDRRGRWRLKDSPISNRQVIEFIGRNYEADEHGAWFFQNGPQRVYVRLDYTPWILRIGDRQSLVTHTGIAVDDACEALLDEEGNLLIAFKRGIGLVEGRDLAAFLDSIFDVHGSHVDEAMLSRMMGGEKLPLEFRWPGLKIALNSIHSNAVPARFGFIANPTSADLG